MKSRTLLLIALGLLIFILGGIRLARSIWNQERESRIFPATINRDCAPWDGAAFTTIIPISDHGTIIVISIWQTPEIKFPVTYSFPDDTGQVGNAVLLHELGLPEQLSGEIFFWRVNQGDLTEGNFDLITEMGQRFKGQFKAEWKNQILLCG